MKDLNQKLTAQQLANALGKNVDTIRKHAKAGKIKGYQDAKGRWTFLLGDFPELLNQPACQPAAPVTTTPKLTDVIFVLDRSGSMSGLYAQAVKNLDDQIATIRKAAGPNDRYRISVINFDSSVTRTLIAQDVALVDQASRLYGYPGGSTRLHDAVLDAISLANHLDTKDKQHAFLISVVTDGEENASNAHHVNVSSKVGECIRGDRYTFAYAGPRNSESRATLMGFLSGNITTWDQTVAGTIHLNAVSNTSLNSYTTSRSRGIVSSTSFYAQPTTLNAESFADKLDDKLDDVSDKVQVERVTANDPLVIQKFCEKKIGSFPKGKIYYQLTESEKVQDYKQLIIQDTATGNFYQGWKAAQKLLSIPSFQGTVRIKPGSLGEFKVFIQSTSVNRKLVPGTAVVYLP